MKEWFVLPILAATLLTGCQKKSGSGGRRGRAASDAGDGDATGAAGNRGVG